MRLCVDVLPAVSGTLRVPSGRSTGAHFITGQMQPRLRRIHFGAAKAAATACKFCSAIVDEYVRWVVNMCVG
jgi:hypothetical protein